MLSVYRARISCTESDAFYWRLECYPDLLLVMARRNRTGFPAGWTDLVGVPLSCRQVTS